MQVKSEQPLRRITWKVFVDMITPGAVLLSAFNPALLGVFLSLQQDGSVQPLLTLFLLLIPSAANCSVNLLNDYYDYISGNDAADNIVAEVEGPLVFHQVEDPKPALYYGAVFFLAACLMGVYVVLHCGAVPAAIGIFGALITATYSGGRFSTSHLPIGEPLSGLTMGGLIPLAVYVSLTGRTADTPLILFRCMPMILVVSLFMLENNTCDMERDAAVGRKTLPMFLGRERAQCLANVLSILWIILLILVTALFFPFGLPVLFAALYKGWASFAATFREIRNRENKLPATAALAAAAFWFSEGYLGAALVHLVVQCLM